MITKAHKTESRPAPQPKAAARKNIAAIYPLTPMQQGMLFHSLQEPDSGVYVMQLECRIRGNIDCEAFERAWQSVINRHEALRAGFFWQKSKEPVQIVSRKVTFKVDQHDWRELTEPAQAERWAAWLLDDRRRGFKLTAAPLIRCTLMQLADQAYRFLWSFHHILMDGWSLPLVLDEVFTLYAHFKRGRSDIGLSEIRPFGQFIAWQRKQDHAAAERFWREELAGFRIPTKIGLERSSEPDQNLNATGYATRTLTLSKDQSTALQVLAQDHQLTLNSLVQGAWALLLSRYSGAQDVVYGVTTAGRPAELAGVETMVGLFINTLPLRLWVDPHTRFVDFAQGIQTRNLRLREYEHVPLYEVQGWSEIPRSEPLFESILVFENYPLEDELLQQRLQDLGVSDITFHEQTNYPLTVVVVPAESLAIRIIHDQGRFEDATIDRLLGHLQTLFERIAQAPETPIAELPWLTPGERQQQLFDWNATSKDYPAVACLSELFEAQVERTPGAPAVVFEGQSLTYRELNSRANQLAHGLRALGVGPDVTVGLCVERSLEMVIGLIGILKAGGAYVPLDPAYPADRLAFMLADAQAPVMVTQFALKENLPATAAKLLCLDHEWGKIEQYDDHNPDRVAALPNLGYVIYTSGSTGRPKGVSLSQGALINLLEWQSSQSQATVGDRTLQFASLSFDVSFQEILSTLSTGGELVLVSEDVRRDIDQLVALIHEQRVNRLFLPFVALNHLAESVADPAGLALKEIITAGEQLKVTPSLIRFFGQLPGCRLFNQYGPSEAHVVSQFTLQGEAGHWPATPPIGTPIANTRLYVLDGELQPVPVGVTGELYIGGVQLARGYLNRPDLTAEKFIPNPFSALPGERLYRTGDLARYREDGNIEFLGRIDHQVKVRGFRIELGEIEAALTQHPDVREAVVIAREDSPGDKRLVAYLTAAGEEPVELAALRAFLKDQLPDYMVPAAFVILDSLPLSPNGKVDRKALPAPDAAAAGGNEYVAPRNPTEQTLADLWAELLSVEQVGVHDNFFDLGGHSLLVTQVVSRLRAVFEVELPLKALFEAPTLVELAAAVEAARQAEAGVTAPPLVPVDRGGAALPLSFAQQRLWFLDRLEPGSAFYNMPGVVRLRGTLDADALRAALNAVIARHENLRTTFATVDGQAVQVIAPVLELSVPLIELTAETEEAREARARALLLEEARQPFDLAAGPLLRVRLIQLAADDHLLQVTLHHIIADGWSLGVFIEELAALYAEQAGGPPAALAPLPVQYADFAHWQRQWLQGEVLEQQLAYWRTQLKGLPARLELPTDHPRPAVQSFKGAHLPIAVPAELTHALRRLSREAGATLFMTLLAAFQVLLARYTGQQDFAVGTPIANRNRAETERLIGCFINSLVLRAELSDDPGFRTLLERTKATTLGAYAHQDLPFERLVDELQPERDMSHTPLFQVMFALQNTPVRALALPGLRLTPWALESGTAKFDLTLDLTESEAGLEGSLEYNTDLFDAATIERLAGHYRTLLAGIVAAPEARVSELPLLTEAERQQLLVDWNATATDYPRDRCIHQLFEAQAAQTPAAPAAVFEDQTLSYAELNAKANQLAHDLRGRGVGPDTLVGLCVERSLDMVIGLLGILKAGGAYVPLDPTYPRERLAYMLADSQAPLLLTQAALVERLPAHAAAVVCLDRDAPQIASHPTTDPVNLTRPAHLAYVIYTSGSTGRPKGVTITHGSLVNLVAWHQNVYDVGPSSRASQVAAPGFDASVWELWPYLTAGASIYWPDDETRSIPSTLYSWLARSAITHCFLPTPLAEALLPLEKPPSLVLKFLLTGGDKLTGYPQRELGFELVNHYGPTENTVVTTAAAVVANQGAGEAPPIGRPLPNNQVYVLDRDLNPVPIGVSGELYVGGIQLARGYLHRPDLTAERFIPHPFSTVPGARLYQTGDLVRYRPDGNLEFLGRIDHQVKVRGFRIELGEIEAALTQHPDVREVVVIAREDHPGEKRLVAYLVGQSGEALEAAVLRAFVAEMLPDYMVPAAFVVLEALPLTPNGKIDREALPAPDADAVLHEDYVAPRNATEQTLADLWAEVLGIERVGVQDSFFDLGGHSLLAVKLAALIEQRLGMAKLPLSTLFSCPTIAQLGAEIQHAASTLESSIVVPFNSNGGSCPLFCLPGADGMALSLQRFAHALGGEQPVYVFQAPGIDGQSEPLTCVEDVARLYIERLRAIQAKGPYQLLGYSFGGWVALEMALQLQGAGEPVDRLVILDTPAPLAQENPVAAWNDQELFESIAGLLLRAWGVELEIDTEELADLDLKTQAERLATALDSTDILPTGIDQTQLQAMLTVLKTNRDIAYTPSATFSGGLTLIRAADTRPEDAESGSESPMANEALRWNECCEEGVAVQWVAGDHSTMVLDPYVKDLADSVNTLLDTRKEESSDRNS